MTLTPDQTQPFFQFISFGAVDLEGALTAVLKDAEGNPLTEDLQPVVQSTGQRARVVFGVINRLPNPVYCSINQGDAVIWQGAFYRQRDDRRQAPWTVQTL